VTAPGPGAALPCEGSTGTFRFLAGHARDRPSWACPGFEGDSDAAQASEVIQILPVLSGRDRQQGDRQQEQPAHDGGDT
jgi:hypothetical protein